jgi:hypothetical protein
MDRMTRVLSVDKGRSQMRVQAQMGVRDLAAAAKAAGLATPRFTLPWWAELTLGGVLATTAHGSGFKVTHQLVSSGGRLVLTAESGLGPACRRPCCCPPDPWLCVPHALMLRPGCLPTRAPHMPFAHTAPV